MSGPLLENKRPRGVSISLVKIRLVVQRCSHLCIYVVVHITAAIWLKCDKHSSVNESYHWIAVVVLTSQLSVVYKADNLRYYCCAKEKVLRHHLLSRVGAL